MRSVNTWLSGFLSEISSYRPLTRKGGSDLAWPGSREAVDRLVCSNLAFVVKIAKEYRHRGWPFEELLLEVSLGLVHAARRFDAEKA